MKTIPGVYDGNNVKPTEKFDARPNTKVLITFLDEDARPLFEVTKIEDVAGCLSATGPARTLDEMNEGVKLRVRDR